MPNENTRRVMSGTAYDRVRGLEGFLRDEYIRGATILDISSSYGYVSYEFARHSPRLIHGIDVDREAVSCCRQLFSHIPVESEFYLADLREGLPLNKATAGIGMTQAPPLLEQYDIVLFLGVFHHLTRQMPSDQLGELVSVLTRKAKRFFVFRTPERYLSSIRAVIPQQEFKTEFYSAEQECVGASEVLRRISEAGR